MNQSSGKPLETFFDVVIPCIKKETAEKIYNQIKRATGYEGEVREVAK